jgi:phage-related holin
MIALSIFHDTILGWAYTIPVVLILADFITGVLAAVHKKEFAWSKLAMFLGNDAVKYMISIGVVLVAQFFGAPQLLIIIGSSGSILVLATAVSASILHNIEEMGAPPALVNEIMTFEQYLLKYMPAIPFVPLSAPVIVPTPLPVTSFVPLPPPGPPAA